MLLINNLHFKSPQGTKVTAKLATGIWFILTLAACDNSTSNTDHENQPSIQNQDEAANYTIGQVKRFELYASDGSLNLCEINQYDSDGYLLTSHEIINNTPTSNLTCDDAISSGRLAEYTYNTDKTKLYSASETDNGIIACSTSTFDFENKRLSQRWHNSALAHQVCDEDKDTTSTFTKSTYIGTLLNTFTLSHNNGADNEWETEDDILKFYLKYTHDVKNNSATIKSSTNYGNDKMWGTEDDVIDEITTITTLAPGIFSTLTSRRNGKIISIAKSTYKNKVLVKNTRYSGPGVDNNWQTFEDNPVSSVSYY